MFDNIHQGCQHYDSYLTGNDLNSVDFFLFPLVHAMIAYDIIIVIYNNCIQVQYKESASFPTHCSRATNDILNKNGSIHAKRWIFFKANFFSIIRVGTSVRLYVTDSLIATL